jgi:aryl-alcohol dehydrogenase-like predicted oxidoreductase
MPDRIALTKELSISRIVCGLWQVADIEKRTARPSTRTEGADALQAYASGGFDTFDMADHYGSAELITGRLLSRYQGSKATGRVHQMVPGTRPDDADVVRRGVEERLHPARRR